MFKPKIVRTCAGGGSRTLDFLRERRTPYPPDQALCTFTEYSVIIISLAVLQMKVVGGRKMGITQCILKKKKKTKKKKMVWSFAV